MTPSKGRLNNRPYLHSRRVAALSICFQSQELKVKRKIGDSQEKKEPINDLDFTGNKLPQADSLLYEQTVWKSVFSQAMLRSSITKPTCHWGKDNA